MANSINAVQLMKMYKERKEHLNEMALMFWSEWVKSHDAESKIKAIIAKSIAQDYESKIEYLKNLA